MLALVAAALLAASPQNDTIHTAGGGRIVGTVVEESPQGITVRMLDGTIRQLDRAEVERIDYADGSVSTPSRPAPPPPAYAPRQPPAYAPPPPAPPPSYAPPPAPPPRYAPPPAPPSLPPPAYAPSPSVQVPRGHARGGMAPISPFYGVLGLGGLFHGGEAEEGVAMDRIFDPQLDVYMEGGLRLSPELALALYADIGVGEPAQETRALNSCDVGGGSCTATTGSVGLLLRHTFLPHAPSTPWIAAGTGFAFGNVSYDDSFGSQELITYSGWEVLRLMAGIDLRANPVFGVGFYGGVSFGRYTSVEDGFGTSHMDGAMHSTVQAGLRFTLFP